MAPRRLGNAAGILSTRYEHGRHNVGCVDVTSQLAVAHLPFPDGHEHVVEALGAAPKYLFAGGIGKLAPGYDLHSPWLLHVSPRGFLVGSHLSLDDEVTDS